MFEPGDTVEVTADCCWLHAVGEVTEVNGPNILVRFPLFNNLRAVPFAKYELRATQQKLEL